MSSIIIDRRKNPHGKSHSNRERFMDRAKRVMRDAARKGLTGRSISDTGGADVNVHPDDGTSEPSFHHSRDIGEWDYVLPGNTDYVPGDSIEKDEGGPGGQGKQGGPGDPFEEDFSFALSYEEYLNLVFDDLELPDLVKQSEKNVVAFEMRRTGHTNVGIPSNLNVERSAIAGLGRRIALRAPKLAKIKELEAERATLCEPCGACGGTGAGGWSDPNGCWDCQATGDIPNGAEEYARIQEIDAEIAHLRYRANVVPFLDDVDMRFNNFAKSPKPSTKAVMICIMDVSGSMGEREKFIAKKFFILLSLFLRRRYENIDVVFVRHHEEADEVDEITFFEGRISGGTVVSSAYDLTQKIITDRYPTDEWNIYMAQASDGDNWAMDNEQVSARLRQLLPTVQYFNYIEIQDEFQGRAGMFGGYYSGNSNLWNTLSEVNGTNQNMAMAKIMDEKEVLAVFRKLFAKDRKEAA